MRYGITPPIWWPFRWWPSTAGFNPGVGLWKMRAVSKQPSMDGATFEASMSPVTLYIGSMTGVTGMAVMSGAGKMATMTAV